MLFQNATVWINGHFEQADVVFENGKLVPVTPDMSFDDASALSDAIILPGFCDVHVHLREPGFCYKETVKSGTAAAARGGYTAVCPMPNLSPVPDSLEHLAPQLEAIERDAAVAVLPYGSLTVGELGREVSDLDGLSPYVVAFSDDGRGIQSEEMMRTLMVRAKALGKIVVAHCEENSLLRGGYIHDGVYAKKHGHRGICSESEWRPIERDLRLAEEIGCAYHVCHVSAKESVDLIRKAKARGVDVTCETGPHYLLLSDKDLREDGKYKMNPPLRGEEDRAALIAGIEDGTIDMIATDHAPHSAEEKSRGLEKSAFGIVGLETAFPLLYTAFVRTGKWSLDTLVSLMCTAPRRRFGITSDIGFTAWDVKTPYKIDPAAFASMGRATPFEGYEVYGNNLLTVYNGKTVYKNF